MINQKRGQMKISFGMIFSIILIIVFIAAATYGIVKFLDMQNTMKTERFKDDLQNDIDKHWASPSSSEVVSYQLPNNIVKICFKNEEMKIYEDETSFPKIESIEKCEFVGGDGVDSFCVKDLNGKITLKLKKDYGDNVVKISPAE